MVSMRFCPHCGKTVDPSDEDTVNGKHESVGQKGYYHGPCWNAVLKKTHDAEVFHK